MPIDVARARALSSRHRTSTCSIRARTNTAGGKGGTRITYTDLHTGELCRIVVSRARELETLAGGRETAITLFDIHLRDDLDIAPSQVIRADGIDYEIVADVSPVTNQYATIARCRRLD